MDYIFESIKGAVKLIFPSPQPEITHALFLSLVLSSAAAILSSLVAIPAGIFISIKNFRFRRTLISFINAWVSVPSVAIGLIVYGILSRKGPLGEAGLLFTPSAVVIAQAILSFPIILALVTSSLKKSALKTKELALSLGASGFQTAIAILMEYRYSIITAVIIGFSRIIGETGMTLMVGGNIKGYTRVLTTTIALETVKGNFEVGLSAGFLLVAVALAINIIIQKIPRVEG